MQTMKSSPVSTSLLPHLCETPCISPPPYFHDRTGYILPKEKPNNFPSFLDKFSDQNLMRINHDKTKLLLFNKSKAIYFLPAFPFGQEENLEVIVSETLNCTNLFLTPEGQNMAPISTMNINVTEEGSTAPNFSISIMVYNSFT